MELAVFLLRSSMGSGPASGVGRALCLVSPLLVGSCYGVYAELPRECMYEKSVLCT